MSEERMTYEDYTRFVTRLGSGYSMADEFSKIGTVGLGLAGEAAEISAIALQYESFDVWPVLAEHQQKLADELGDICWYVAFAAGNVVSMPLADLMPPAESTPLPLSSIRLLGALTARLSTDCGAVADIAKKLLYHGKRFDVLTQQKIIDRLGNILYCTSQLAKSVCGVTLDDCIAKNVAKLSERYKSLRFTTEEFMAKEAGESV